MSESYLRLLEIELTNFKNITTGSIDFQEKARRLRGDFEITDASLLGIFGQNGSGKTGVIDALSILHELSAASLPRHSGARIMFGARRAALGFTFLYHEAEANYLIRYETEIKRFRSVGHLARESVKYKTYNGKTWGRWKTLLAVDYEQKLITPPAAKRLLKEFPLSRTKSLCFDKSAIAKLLSAAYPQARLLKLLQYELETNLIIIDSYGAGIFYLDSYADLDAPERVYPASLKINLFGTNYYGEDEYRFIKKQIEKNNLALTQIIPGLQIISREKRHVDNKDAARYSVEFFSVRDDNVVALRNESKGIKRLVSLIGAVISVYNNPSFILAVDEFDAGVFEYLLGDLLEVIQNEGKGQLIFTSHNLRVLELLNKEDILFTTNRADNRYRRVAKVSSRLNLRDAYLRSLFLNEHHLAERTDQYSIGRALRKAGRKYEK